MYQSTMALPTCNFGAISNFSLAYTDINCFGFSVSTAGDLNSCESICVTSPPAPTSPAPQTSPALPIVPAPEPPLPAALALQRSGASRQSVSTCDFVCQQVRVSVVLSHFVCLLFVCVYPNTHSSYNFQ